MLDTAPCGFLSLADDGTVLQTNATFDRLAEAEHLAGQHVDTVLTPGARIFYQTHVFPLLKVQGKAEEIYLSLRTPGGADVPVLLNAVRHERDGRPVSDVVVVPMRRRNQFESELLQAKRAAEEASHARARFLSVLSHDLRAPLSAINLAAEILASGAVGEVNDAQRHDLARIAEASSYVLALVKDLLAFSRLDADRVDVRLRPLRLADVLDRATGLVGHLVKRAGLDLEPDIAEGTGQVLADPERLQQVLLNLLTNAVKFTEPGGRITLAARPDGDRVCIYVRDTGRGIPPEELEAIFEPFVQLDPEAAGEQPRDGVGLGLAISRDLVRAMQGELTVESEVGRGSTFSVRLPAVPEAAPPAA